MFGHRGQAFDAFKLLIAAVVAGAILVIILSMLGGFVTPGGDPITVMAQTVQQLRGSPYSGMTSTQVVTFSKGTISAAAIWTKAGTNPGSVGFCGGSCGDDACGEGKYSFTNFPDAFDVTSGSGQTGDQLMVKNKMSGYIWVYNQGTQDEGPTYCIGFMRSE